MLYRPGALRFECSRTGLPAFPAPAARSRSSSARRRAPASA